MTSVQARQGSTSVNIAVGGGSGPNILVLSSSPAPVDVNLDLNSTINIPAPPPSSIQTQPDISPNLNSNTKGRASWYNVDNVLARIAFNSPLRSDHTMASLDAHMAQTSDGPRLAATRHALPSAASSASQIVGSGSQFYNNNCNNSSLPSMAQSASRSSWGAVPQP